MNKNVILANAKRKAKQGMPLTALEADLLMQEGWTIDTTRGRRKKDAKPQPKSEDIKPKAVETEIAPNNMNAHTIGLWKNGRRFLTSPITKSRIPKKWARLLFIQNKGKRKDNKQPDYIGYFIDSDINYKEINYPYIALRKTIEDNFGSVAYSKDEGRDLASEIFNWMRDNEDLLLDAIHGGWDSSGIIYRLEYYFNE
jgi:hypothetical protein